MPWLFCAFYKHGTYEATRHLGTVNTSLAKHKYVILQKYHMSLTLILLLW